MVAGMQTPGEREAPESKAQPQTMRFSTRRRAGRTRRLMVTTAVVAVLAASYAFALVALIAAPGGNRFQGWPLYVFCAVALLVAAAGTVADSVRQTRRAQTSMGEAQGVCPVRHGGSIDRV